MRKGVIAGLVEMSVILSVSAVYSNASGAGRVCCRD
jgi:hypothetical protein